MRINLYDQVQAFMSVEPLDRLRAYLSQAPLPPMKLSPKAPQMPPQGHHSHKNNLSVVPKQYRLLEKMYVIESADFRSSIRTALDHHVTQDKLAIRDADNVENVTIPCPPSFQLAAQPPMKPSNLVQLCRWVSQFPLDSAQAVLHNIFPQTEDWSFSPVRSDVDEDIFQSFIWSPTATTTNATGGPGSVSVFVQPPWILAPKDLLAFSRCDTIRRASEIEEMTEEDQVNAYVSKERLWAKVWDECQRNGSHYFVVTTYLGWVFGTFSAGRVHAFATDVIKAEQMYPTVLESLVFWLMSAMGIQGGWEVPEVPEPFHPLLRSSPVPRPSQKLHHAPSESEFSVHSSARASQADIEDANDQIAIEHYLLGTTAKGALPESNPFVPPSRSHDEVRVGIHSWRHRSRGVPPPPPSVSSEVSASTIRDYGDHDYQNGDWMQ